MNTDVPATSVSGEVILNKTQTDDEGVKTLNPVSYCYQQYPDMMQEFERLQEEDLRTFCSKQMDYGPGNVSMGTQLKNDEEKHFSLSALNIRINDKVQRLLHLINRTRRKPNNESIEDAYKDMSVYGIISRLVINNKWAK